MDDIDAGSITPGPPQGTSCRGVISSDEKRPIVRVILDHVEVTRQGRPCNIGGGGRNTRSPFSPDDQSVVTNLTFSGGLDSTMGYYLGKIFSVIVST